jgi:hypothetical protein
VKKKFILIALIVICHFVSKAQQAVGRAERTITDSICNCLSRQDFSQIKSKEEATAVYTKCVTGNSDLLVDFAAERKVDMTDLTAMRELGIDLAKDLMKEKCAAFMKLSVVMAGKSSVSGTGTSYGIVKRIDNKGFNYIVITDAEKKEQSFLWFTQFVGSEKFTGLPASYAGKKVAVSWKEVEVYLPQAKGYYKVKEITAVDVL